MSKAKKAATSRGGTARPETSADKNGSTAGAANEALMKELQEELKKERQERALFQQERDKIQEFWDITKKQLEQTRLTMEQKDRELEKKEEGHQQELKQYKQKVKHLLFEYQTNLTRVQADADKQVDLSRDDHVEDEKELRRQVRSLKVELKELELSHHEVLKNLKAAHNEEILKLSRDYEMRTKELAQKYINKTKASREELELKRKMEVHEVEERKNVQIAALIKNHEKQFAEMKGYFNDITLNNLALINTLKEQLEESKKAEERNERFVSEIGAENKKLKEPLEAAIAEGEQLRRQLKNHDKDLQVLKHCKARLKQLEEQNKQLTWKNDILTQRCTIIEKEKESLTKDFSSKCREIEQKIGLKSAVLETKLREVKMSADAKDVQLQKVAQELSAIDSPAVASIMPVSQKLGDTLNEKDSLIRNLYKELMKTINMYNVTVKAMQEYLEKYDIPAKELPFQAIRMPQIWALPEGSMNQGNGNNNGQPQTQTTTSST